MHFYRRLKSNKKLQIYKTFCSSALKYQFSRFDFIFQYYIGIILVEYSQ